LTYPSKERYHEFTPYVKIYLTIGIVGMVQKSFIDTKLYEIRWHGRGGQGAITAAKIIAQAAYLNGYNGVTAAPSFGAERRGAPVSASTRISPQPVMVMSQVEKPNVVVVLDDTLLKDPDTISGLNSEGWLVVNSRQHPKELKRYGDFNIASADATRVCQELGLIVSGLTIVNTAILGALIRATEIVDMVNLEKVIRERFSSNAIDRNLAAIAKTYEITKLYKTR
jgi:2-oxoacid:acceptor oxidoreductase gamma subunit (pyruvate/2-ketoisovalerate family)